MEYTEKTISSEQIFKGVVVDLKVDTVELDNGNKATRELVSHPGGVGIVAVDDDNNIFLVKQFRKPFDKMVTEIPAGKLEYGENPDIAVLREFEEEVGYKAGNLCKLGAFYASVGFCNEVIHIYLATDLEYVGAHPDEDEFLDVVKMDFDKAYEAVLSGELKDGKTVIGILMARERLYKL